MAEVTLENVKKVYADGTEAVKDLSLQIADGELVVFVGPSGCGKTTALRMVAGLEEISSGTITIGGQVVNQLPPRERDVARVFQNYALYPHKTVYDNLACPLRLRGRVAVMRKGKLPQVAGPQALYARPANLFVAGFIGSPSMNFVQGTLENGDGRLSVAFGQERIVLDEKERAEHSSLGDHVGAKVIVGIRPEHLEDAALLANGRQERQVRGLVRLKEAL